ncbi:hypothetical protein, partial [Iodidimonas nitroreducens]|uniref:hypothetical protein n=1 Tax=Iodidimonas nitroreducens TaxID=1236968 RepID=UPI0028D224F4
PNPMKLYQLKNKNGYNPLLFLSYINCKNSACIFTYSYKSFFRATLSIILSTFNVGLIFFTIKISNISGYALLFSTFIFTINMLFYFYSLIGSRYCTKLPLQKNGRAPDIFAMEWFLIFLSGAMICIFGSRYFDSVFNSIIFILIGIIVFLFSTLPFFGDRIAAKFDKSEYGA